MFRKHQPIDFNETRNYQPAGTEQAGGKDVTNIVIGIIIAGIVSAMAALQYLVP